MAVCVSEREREAEEETERDMYCNLRHIFGACTWVALACYLPPASSFLSLSPTLSPSLPLSLHPSAGSSVVAVCPCSFCFSFKNLFIYFSALCFFHFSLFSAFLLLCFRFRFRFDFDSCFVFNSIGSESNALPTFRRTAHRHAQWGEIAEKANSKARQVAISHLPIHISHLTNSISLTPSLSPTLSLPLSFSFAFAFTLVFFFACAFVALSPHRVWDASLAMCLSFWVIYRFRLTITYTILDIINAIIVQFISCTTFTARKRMTGGHTGCTYIQGVPVSWAG